MKLLHFLTSLLLAASPLHAQTNGMAEYQKSKYGFFVHFVWGGGPGTQFTKDRSGKQPATFDEFAATFDAKGFANDLDRWSVEYVILTAWHYNINPLFPSETMKKWGMAKHACKRDLLGDVIAACKAKGIKVMFYTHPRDGHDLQPEDQLKTGWGGPNGSDPKWETFDRKKWNDFTSELYHELVARYGKDLIGIYSDEGSSAADSYKVVDYPRLRCTVKELQPDLIMVQNWYGSSYSLDTGCKEYHHWGEFANTDASAWPAYRMAVATCFATTWWSAVPTGKNTVVFKPEDMFRYTVLQAGANDEGGGVQWAAGNYAGGGWETGVDETMTQLGSYIKPIAASIKNVFASTSWPTATGTKLPDLKWGVATRATDDSIEYLHVLTPPPGGAKSLNLPPPADGKRFDKAVLLAGKKTVTIQQDGAGVHLQLPAGENWDKLDTVIALKTAADSPPVNLALWKAFRASSFPDSTAAGGSAFAFHAVDGNPATAWSSRPDGITPGNEPVTADTMPWCQVDLGKSAKLTRIEILGSLGADVAVSVSSDPGFGKAKILGTTQATGPAILEIRKATYGKGDKMADVTAKVRQAVVSGGLSVKAENALSGGDPAPETPKELRVEFTLNGKDDLMTVAENDMLSIGNAGPWIIDISNGTAARFVRLARTKPGPPLRVNEFRVIGKFE